MESTSRFSLKSSVDSFCWPENSIDDVLVTAVSDDSQSFTTRMGLEEETACNEQLNDIFNETLGNDLFDFLNSPLSENADLTCPTLQRLGSPVSPSSCHQWDDLQSTTELDTSNDCLGQESDTSPRKSTKVRGRKNGARSSKSMTKNAIAARRNREKNKAYVLSLERQVKERQHERDQLLAKSKGILDLNDKLSTELTFLKGMVSYMDEFTRKIAPSASNITTTTSASFTSSQSTRENICGVCRCCQFMSKSGLIST